MWFCDLANELDEFLAKNFLYNAKLPQKDEKGKKDVWKGFLILMLCLGILELEFYSLIFLDPLWFEMA